MRHSQTPAPGPTATCRARRDRPRRASSLIIAVAARDTAVAGWRYAVSCWATRPSQRRPHRRIDTAPDRWRRRPVFQDTLQFAGGEPGRDDEHRRGEGNAIARSRWIPSIEQARSRAAEQVRDVRGADGRRRESTGSLARIEDLAITSPRAQRSRSMAIAPVAATTMRSTPQRGSTKPAIAGVAASRARSIPVSRLGQVAARGQAWRDVGRQLTVWSAPSRWVDSRCC